MCKMKRRRMIYLMAVSWYWIKQRPQFLAIELAKELPVTVACLEDHGNNISDDKEDNISFVSFWVPNFPFFKSIFNFWVKRFQLAYQLRKYSLVWITSPSQFLLIAPFIKKTQFVIYDCMDDIPEFYPSENTRIALRALEAELCRRSNLVITTSNVLKQRLIERYQLEKPVYVINNGLDISSGNSLIAELPNEIAAIFSDKGFKYLVYIGTIAGWFNFEQMINVLNNHPAIRLIMVGPGDKELATHPQIIYTGAVAHSLVDPIMDAADALIMPFKITDLVRAVNPVKAYEYISSGKPVLLSCYEETEAFESFAYLFDEDQQLNEYVSLLSSNTLSPKRSLQACKDFAKENTWKSRAAAILQLIDLNYSGYHS
jgi:glycosyltransferase involved in cell wall biosynthesis